jgi:DNA-binding response OmpR family regulator
MRALSPDDPARARSCAAAELAVDRPRHRASRPGNSLTLTRKAFGALECLAGADGATVSAEQLLEHICDACLPVATTLATRAASSIRIASGRA